MRRLLSAVACAWLAACSGMGTRAAPRPAATAPQALALYVVRRGWHVDVGVATTDLLPALQPVSAAFQGSRVLLFGFGDRHYLLHPNAGTMVAALWPGAGLVMVTGVHAPRPQDIFGEENVVRLGVTPQQMSDLQSFIARSFAVHDGAPVPVAPGPFEGAYYEAAQRYSGVHTCNTWAAQALESAQLPIDSSGVEFAWQLWHRVQPLADSGAHPRSLREPSATFVQVAANDP